MNKEKYKDFSDEVLFKVGQRVHLELPEIPKEQRDVTTGILIKVNTMFPLTPKHRHIRCTIRFDGKGNYVKKEYRLMGGISFTLTCDQDRLTAI